MPVQDYEIEPTDDALCTRHMTYRPCRACDREEAQIEKMESQKERD